MFEKIVSLLPYNPGLAHQLAFYSRRMREEASIRRTGLIFLVLAFMIQFFAVISPPQPTVADSTNDLIAGGVSSAADAKANCLRDTRGYMRILHYYGISCAAFDTSQRLTIHVNGQNYYSMGHHPYGVAGETPVAVPGLAHNVYWRPLKNVALQKSFDALRVRNQDGHVFYILMACGNLVAVGLPSPSPLQKPAAPAPAPQPAVQTQTQTQTQMQQIIINQTTPPPAPCQYNGSLAASDSQCKPCDKSVSSSDTLACVSVHKAARNDTQAIADANGTTANPGDVITYTLSAQNNGKTTVKSYAFQESLSDVLDYATVADMHGGTIDTEGNVSWPAMDLAAGDTATKQITVKVKDQIPETPVAADDPMHFDLTMTNVYGDTINIKVPGSVVKSVETTTTASNLPNTGPGTSLLIAGLVVVAGGYFYARARLLAQESNLALKEAANA